jgi:hypothetical protein
MRPTLPRLIALYALCWLPSALAADLGWLTGRWELSYDPDNNPKDWVEFRAGGEAVSISHEGKRVPGRYAVDGDEVQVTFDVDGTEVPLTLRCSADKSRLTIPARHSSGFSLYSKLR